MDLHRKQTLANVIQTRKSGGCLRNTCSVKTTFYSPKKIISFKLKYSVNFEHLFHAVSNLSLTWLKNIKKAGIGVEHLEQEVLRHEKKHVTEAFLGHDPERRNKTATSDSSSTPPQAAN